MFVQHMLAVTRPGGMVTTVMPHGVLFRAGDEGRIRTGFLIDDLVEAVIGLGPQLFYGTGIPACILVLRPVGSKPTARRGKVLFINADRDYREGRAQNFLEPEHIEKIVSAYRVFEDIPGFARLVGRAELAENDDNLNIRRYVDTTPAPEPQDVRAHLHGGIPTSEVTSKADLFTAHNLAPDRFFLRKDDDYVLFADVVSERRELRRLIESDSGVVAAEGAVIEAIGLWWEEQEARFDKLQSQSDLVDLRKELIETFRDALASTPLLDPFAIRGIVASWWGESLPDLKALATHGYQGLIEAWVATVLDALAEEKAKVNPLDHKVARALLPEYLDGLADLEVEVAELDSMIKAATASDEEEGDGEPAEDALSPAELKKMQSKLTATKKQLKAEKAALADRLATASTALNDTSARQVVLDAMEHDLLAEANDRVTRHRRAVIAAFEMWWDKYQTPLSALEAKRGGDVVKVTAFLRELGYE
jgi:type I restriction enzyme M protein